MSGIFNAAIFNNAVFNTGAAEAEATVKTGGKGDNAAQKRATLRAVKPTGLAPRRKGKAQHNPAVEARVAETAQIAQEVSRETQDGAVAPQTSATLMTMAQVAEIQALLQKTLRSEEEEILLLTLIAAAAA